MDDNSPERFVELQDDVTIPTNPVSKAVPMHELVVQQSPIKLFSEYVLPAVLAHLREDVVRDLVALPVGREVVLAE